MIPHRLSIELSENSLSIGHRRQRDDKFVGHITRLTALSLPSS